MRLIGVGGWVAVPGRAASAVGWGHLALVVLLWGSGPVAIGYGVSADGGFGPLWLGASRLLLAAGVLIAVGAARGYGFWPRSGLVRPILAGLIGWSVGNGAQVFAQTHATASVAALIIGLSPVFALALDSLWEGRLPAVHHVLAVAISLGGLALLIGGASGDTPLWAVGMLVLAALGWAAAAVLERRRPVLAAPSLSAGWQMLWGGLGLWIAAVLTGEPLPTPTLVGWLAWAWLALACAAVGFLSWIEVLRRMPVALAMTQPTLSTAVAVCLGALLLAETLEGGAILGMMLAFVGAGLAAIPPGPLRKRRVPQWMRRGG